MKQQTETIVLQATNEMTQKMMDFYHDQSIAVKDPYVRFQAKTEQCTIRIYTTNKVVFQGIDAKQEAMIWDHQLIQSKQPEQVPEQKHFVTHCGSDEVGTGDYFGPVCVCACYISETEQQQLAIYPITDSKQMNDELIWQIGPILQEIVPHSLLVVDNPTYNRIHQTYNMNEIKALLHNQAYVHLRNKIHKLPSLCVVDQFTPMNSYYRYLQKEPQIITGLHFETKAESKYLAVACASVIARYAFLKAMKQLEEQFQVSLPKGASAKVDQAAQGLVRAHGWQILSKIAKLHFANTQKLQP